MDTFEANPTDLQPSQLYICSDKLAEVERSMRTQQDSSIDPLPVKRLGPRPVLTDGHTRAFVAFLQGRTYVRVYWETDQLDWEAYEACVQWCLEKGIRSVADLQTRVVTAEQYEELWCKRCHVLHARLATQRKEAEGTTRSSHAPSDTAPSAVRSGSTLTLAPPEKEVRKTIDDGRWPARRNVTYYARKESPHGRQERQEGQG